MPTFYSGDFVKVEFVEESTGEVELMWVCVDSCDEENQLVFGRLDSLPVLNYGDKLRPGSRLAVSFEKILDHKRPNEF